MGVSYAQTRKSGKKNKREAVVQQGSPTTLEPYYPKKDYTAPKQSTKKKDSGGPTYESQEAYAKRMVALDKTRRKNERIMMKPQYSDPMYFGHKRPPKKRPAGKMKYCKVCGIKH
jgi:hypothetical protein